MAAKSLALQEKDVAEVASAGKWHIFDGCVSKRILGLFRREKHMVRVLDRNGVVTLQREGLGVIVTNKGKLKTDLETLFEETATYGTVGEELPGVFAYYGEKQLDLSGLTTREQILSVLEAELDPLPRQEPVILLAAK